MIFSLPAVDEDIDQGDLIDGCPFPLVSAFDGNVDTASVSLDVHRVIVLTQTCDLANKKVDVANVASIFEADELVTRQILKAGDIKGPLRAGRVWGYYFLPADAGFGLGEMIVDLRRLHTVRIDLLISLCRNGKRRARLLTPYREHLAKHFGDTFSRIGLPRPYETM